MSNSNQNKRRLECKAWPKKMMIYELMINLRYRHIERCTSSLDFRLQYFGTDNDTTNVEHSIEVVLISISVCRWRPLHDILIYARGMVEINEADFTLLW